QGADFLSIITLGICVYVAIVFAKTSLAELVVLAVIFSQVVSAITKLQKFLQQAADNESSYIRTQQLIKNVTEHREISTGTLPPILTKECRFERVSFAYGKSPVIRDVSMTIPANAITVLQGPSGAGKTTLIDLLIALHRPDKGVISLDGVPLAD